MRHNTPKQTLNSQIEKLENHPDITVNQAGGVAYKSNVKSQLVKRTCAAMFGEDSFYEKGSTQVDTIKQLFKELPDNEKPFILKLANFARSEMQLRSMPIFLLALYASEGEKMPQPRPELRAYASKIVQRGDEVAETLAAFINLKGSKKQIPRALLKGLSDALNKFNEYSLAKNDKNSASISLKDVMRIVHPKPANPEKAELFKKAAKDELKTPDTWETFISQNGSTAKNWDIASEKMGLFALVRNLRNFEQHGAHKAIKRTIDQLQDLIAVKKSRMLPFRFLAARNNVTNDRVINALNDALHISVENLDKMPGITAVFVDRSGSMSDKLSAKSDLTRHDAAQLLGAMAVELSDEAHLFGYADTVEKVHILKRDSILTNVDKLKQCRSGGTHTYETIRYLTSHKVAADRVIIVTDEMGYGGNVATEWLKYRKFNPKAKLYFINVAAYGSNQTPEDMNGVNNISGFSENVFKFIKVNEQTDIVSEIESKW